MYRVCLAAGWPLYTVCHGHGRRLSCRPCYYSSSPSTQWQTTLRRTRGPLLYTHINSSQPRQSVRMPIYTTRSDKNKWIRQLDWWKLQTATSIQLQHCLICNTRISYQITNGLQTHCLLYTPASKNLTPTSLPKISVNITICSSYIHCGYSCPPTVYYHCQRELFNRTKFTDPRRLQD